MRLDAIVAQGEECPAVWMVVEHGHKQLVALHVGDMLQERHVPERCDRPVERLGIRLRPVRAWSNLHLPVNALGVGDKAFPLRRQRHGVRIRLPIARIVPHREEIDERGVPSVEEVRGKVETQNLRLDEPAGALQAVRIRHQLESGIVAMRGFGTLARVVEVHEPPCPGIDERRRCVPYA